MSYFYRWMSLSGGCLSGFSYMKHAQHRNRYWKSNSKVLGFANLVVSEAALKFLGFYNLTPVGDIWHLGHQGEMLFFQEMLQKHERPVWARVLGKCFYTRKSGHWHYKQALGALMSPHNVLCYFIVVLCSFKVLVENPENVYLAYGTVISIWPRFVTVSF